MSSLKPLRRHKATDTVDLPLRRVMRSMTRHWFVFVSLAVQSRFVPVGCWRTNSSLDQHIGQLALAMQSPLTTVTLIVIIQHSPFIITDAFDDTFSWILRTSKKCSQRRRFNSSKKRDRRYSAHSERLIYICSRVHPRKIVTYLVRV